MGGYISGMDGRTNPAAPETRDASADSFEELRLRLEDPDWSTWTEADFEGRALSAFAFQFETCEPYRAFCRHRGITPDNVGSWEAVPAVPATAFKYFDFTSAPEMAPHHDPRFESGLFLTSGTTRGTQARGRHHVPSLGLYRASLAEPFRRALLPELEPGGDPTALFLSLIPSPAEAPDSSLSFMVGAAAQRYAREVVWLVDGDGRWAEGAVPLASEEVESARRSGEPVLLLGTALSFVHLIESAESEPDVAACLAALPDSARVMETGGFKGSRRSVTRDALYEGIERVTGIARHRIVNEYGMTELLSQLYEGGSSGGARSSGAPSDGLHRPPPWLEVRALDPTDLTPLPEGRDGILGFFDLANLGSVCHVLTEDVGSVHDGGVRLKGRALGAEPRGCSRAMDDLMSAARG
ncbi:MAG: hypothetical protein HKN72_14245 [Gemmatimonadetes bacterium]|nr:hypothetical protein [Gemmatimonadota bacterium]